MLSVPMVLFGKRRRATSSSLKLASERGGALLTLKKEFLHCTALLLFVSSFSFTIIYLNLFLEKKSRPRSWPKVQLRLKKMSTDSSPKSLKGFSFFSSPPPLQLQLRNQRPPRHQCWPLKNTPNGRMHQSILPHAGHHPKGLASAPSVQAVVKNKWDTKS